MSDNGSAIDESNSSQLNPRERTSFKIWTSHTIRYNDQDPLGHVNNAV